MGLSRALTDWWRRRRLTAPQIDRVARYPRVGDIPEDLDRHTLALVGPNDAPKWAALACPCGYGHRVVVSLQAAHHPHWRLVTGNGRHGLWPSIDSVAERRCHFWLREGRVRWIDDYL